MYATQPDFGALASSAQDDADRSLITALQGVYSSQPPEVQNAIGIILSAAPDPADLKAANDYLKSVGIDIDQLVGPKAQYRGTGRGQIKTNSASGSTASKFGVGRGGVRTK